jgi:hypothetical protein
MNQYENNKLNKFNPRKFNEHAEDSQGRFTRRSKRITNYEEKDIDLTPKLLKKRKRVTIKRGINCAWTAEDVRLLITLGQKAFYFS